MCRGRTVLREILFSDAMYSALKYGYRSDSEVRVLRR